MLLCGPLHNLTFNSPTYEHAISALLYVLCLWGVTPCFPLRLSSLPATWKKNAG